MLKPGTILDDRYEIIDVVGTGGMSTVYRAKDERLRRFVAIKVLKSDYSSDQNFVSKFRAEAQSSAGLTHPNIVSVYDVCEDDGRYFIVMELVEGITLKEYINLNGRLSMAQAIDFSIQIASGLEAAHDHHVIHRDIKPQNIIVSKSGNIKVTDFGIAKAATSTTMSTTGIGSVHYISPEQARGGYSDERSDIYSLGITMYEMVTGRVPFEGDTNVAIALMHIQNDMIPPRQLYADIYPSFEKIIMKASQKKPERRYLTAAALIADLNRVRDNPNIDIIVAPSTVTGAPTHQFTPEDMAKIKNGSSRRGYEDGTNQGAGHYAGNANGQARKPESSEVRPDRSRIEALLNQQDEDYYDDEPQVQAPPRKTSKNGVKKVEDDYDDVDDRDTDEEDVDPKLEKAVMIGGIAAAVIVAIIVFVLIGNMMGWFDFGSRGGDDEKTTEGASVTTTAEAETETETTTEAVASVSMIDVVGLSEKAAEKDLKEAGLNNFEFIEEYSVDVKQSYVISQNVEPKTDIPKDTKIIITVSAGAEELTVADVRGMDEDTAYNTLEQQGFKPTRSYKFDEEIENGHAIKTDPAAESKLKAGEAITIYISQGQEEKTVGVPDLSGLTEAVARGSLEANSLVVGNVTYEFDSNVPEGQVIRQSVAANTEVKEGTVVDIVISNGPESKTYKGTVTGTISTADETLISTNVTVSVYVNDNDGYHQVYTVTQMGSTFEVNGAAEGLQYNNGTVSFTVVDAEGNDVSNMYSKSLTLSYESE
ncbi:MAG: Stk1 family PASTA domain-containing Ser/Thr kinase [Eubacterium sp.]|nr:Stk1 family PASTA domain-containing Ser/Thr kinase [Eubacterium sp.]